MIPWLVTSSAAAVGVWIWGGLANPLWAIAAANVAGLLTLLLVQRIERAPRLKAGWVKGTFRTWVVCILIFAAALWLLVPELRELRRLAGLYIPLAFCAGLIAPWVFGPLQDAAIRRVQRRARGFTDPAPRAKS